MRSFFRTAKVGERFYNPHGKERILLRNADGIAMRKNLIAVAGVMGGANTEISNSTVDVLY